VRITDADVAPELGGAPFFVMEYLRGHDLGAELAARTALQPIEVVFYMRQAARALDKAHALGIIHRDLKPENLFLTEREDGVPCIKLVDFGIAKVTGEAAAMAQIASRTQTGRIFGTPLFMSPEQATGRVSQIGPATDIWALGLVVHKLLTGRDHFEADTIAELIGKIVYSDILPPSKAGVDFGPRYDAWFLRCCHREATLRFRNASEAITDLATALRVEEGDALIDAVVSLRRSRPEIAYRETIPVMLDDASSLGEASTLDPLKLTHLLPVEANVMAPLAGLPALAPPPVPPAGLTPLPVAPPLLPFAPPAVPPLSPGAQQETIAGSAGPIVRAADDDASPHRMVLRSGAIFVAAVVSALALGLGLGILFLRPPSGATRPDDAASSASPASPPPPATSKPAVSPRPSASPAASASPSSSASPAPSGSVRGNVKRNAPDVLKNRY
jgi:eukaryotic-like serine/threonine-protein kinase